MHPIGCRRRLAEHRLLASLVAIYLVIVVLVIPPTGEFPTYDDGVFAATARDFAERGAMRISDLPSMSLVAHAAWGAAFIKVLGDTWWSLRVSTMVMAWIGGLALYVLALEFGRSPAQAALSCAAYIFCPLVFALNYMFMTDLTGTSLMLVSLAGMPACLRSGAPIRFASLGIVGGVCYLARQTAAIPVIVLGVVLGVECILRRRKWLDLVGLGGPMVLMAAGYRYWLHEINGVPSVYGSVPLNFEIFTNVKGLASKFLGIALEAALLAAPLILSSVRLESRRLPAMRPRTCATGVIVAAYAALVAIFADELRAYRGYELFDVGLGFPPTHEGLSAAFRSPVILRGMTWFHLSLLIPAAGLLGCLVAKGILAARDNIRSWKPDPLGVVQIVVLLSIVGYFGLLLLIEFVFDRYVIPLIVLLLVALSSDRRTDASQRCLLSWLACAAMTCCCIVGTQDAMQTRKVYWRTVARLWQAGVDVEELNAGITYWQAYQYEPAIRRRLPSGQTFLAGLHADRWNGPDADEVAWSMAFGEFVGWKVHERVPFDTWIRSGEILVMRRAD